MDCLLRSRANRALFQLTTFVWCAFLSIILTVWLVLALIASSFMMCLTQASEKRLSRRVCSSPSFQSSTFRQNRIYCPQKSHQSCSWISRPSC